MEGNLTAWNQLKALTLSTAEIRAVDRRAIEEYGMHSLVLMENAALGCVHWLQRRLPNGPSTILLCGRGNNGGDGLVIARQLQVLGWPVQVLLPGPVEKLSADAQANWKVLTADGSTVVRLVEDISEELPGCMDAIASGELIVDAMLGTGATGTPRSPFREWIEAANESPAFRVAIDLPTGIDAETGAAASPSFQPHTTLTFVARKPAMAAAEASKLFGEIEVLPIGIPESLVRRIVEEQSRAQ